MPVRPVRVARICGEKHERSSRKDPVGGLRAVAFTLDEENYLR
jgi:hypothetical protein